MMQKWGKLCCILNNFKLNRGVSHPCACVYMLEHTLCTYESSMIMIMKLSLRSILHASQGRNFILIKPYKRNYYCIYIGKQGYWGLIIGSSIYWKLFRLGGTELGLNVFLFDFKEANAFWHCAIPYFKVSVKPHYIHACIRKNRHAEQSGVISVCEKSGTFYIKGKIWTILQSMGL